MWDRKLTGRILGNFLELPLIIVCVIYLNLWLFDLLLLNRTGSIFWRPRRGGLIIGAMAQNFGTHTLGSTKLKPDGLGSRWIGLHFFLAFQNTEQHFRSHHQNTPVFHHFKMNLQRSPSSMRQVGRRCEPQLLKEPRRCVLHWKRIYVIQTMMRVAKNIVSDGPHLCYICLLPIIQGHSM